MIGQHIYNILLLIDLRCLILVFTLCCLNFYSLLLGFGIVHLLLFQNHFKVFDHQNIILKLFEAFRIDRRLCECIKVNVNQSRTSCELHNFINYSDSCSSLELVSQAYSYGNRIFDAWYWWRHILLDPLQSTNMCRIWHFISTTWDSLLSTQGRLLG